MVAFMLFYEYMNVDASNRLMDKQCTKRSLEVENVVRT